MKPITAVNHKGLSPPDIRDSNQVFLAPGLRAMRSLRETWMGYSPPLRMDPSTEGKGIHPAAFNSCCRAQQNVRKHPLQGVAQVRLSHIPHKGSDTMFRNPPHEPNNEKMEKASLEGY